jgi:hypothetical protein
MDTTVQTALKIISTLSDENWRKKYWIGRVTQEIFDYRSTGIALCIQEADTMEKELNIAIAFTSNQKKEAGVPSP